MWTNNHSALHRWKNWCILKFLLHGWIVIFNAQVDLRCRHFLMCIQSFKIPPCYNEMKQNGGGRGGGGGSSENKITFTSLSHNFFNSGSPRIVDTTSAPWTGGLLYMGLASCCNWLFTATACFSSSQSTLQATFNRINLKMYEGTLASEPLSKKLQLFT